MNFKEFGDNAVLIQFENIISTEIQGRVMRAYEGILASNIRAVQYMIPAYNSLTVVYDRSLIGYSEICLKLTEAINSSPLRKQRERRLVTIPVCYEPNYALDIEHVSNISKKSIEEVIDLHTGHVYDLYMIGFLPGFPYLGILPDELHVSRLEEPRKKVVKGSVGIAGLQTGIYPFHSPGGWRIIGHTPIPIFDPNATDPFLFQMGDRVKFRSISINEHQFLTEMVGRNQFNLSKYIHHA